MNPRDWPSLESSTGRTFTPEERERILTFQAATALLQRLVDARRDYLNALIQADHAETRKGVPEAYATTPNRRGGVVIQSAEILTPKFDVKVDHASHVNWSHHTSGI